MTEGSSFEMVYYRHCSSLYPAPDPGGQSVTGMTGGNAENVFAVGHLHGDLNVIGDPIKNIRDRTNKRIEHWTKGMVKTAALTKVMEMIARGTTWVTIKGYPGEGKTTVAYMALQEISMSKRQVFQVVSPEEFFEVTSACPEAVIFLDDIFGNLEFDHAEWLKWKPVLQHVLEGKLHRSHEKGITASKENEETIILVGRDYVLTSASSYMGKICDYFTHDAHVVYMSNTTDRVMQEKIAIWEVISDASRIELDRNTVEKICHIVVPHGFPNVCKLFVTIRHEDANIDAVSFFNAPLQFLNQTVQKLLRDRQILQLFQEIIKRSGEVSILDLEKIENGVDIIDAANNLVGTYLSKEEGKFSFKHASIYDSVAFILCTMNPSFVIENCHLSFIHERLRLEPLHNSPSNEPGFVVNISRDCIPHLIKRFAIEVSNRNLVLVLSHKAFIDEVFIQEFMQEFIQNFMHLNELIKLTDVGSDEETENEFFSLTVNQSHTFLSLIASNKSPQLLKYIDNQYADKKLSKRCMKTVLYGVCIYAASDVLAYLVHMTHGKLDINVKYEAHKTPLMIASGTRDSLFVNQILNLKPGLNERDRWNKTIIHYLCENNLTSAVEQVIDKVTDIDVEDIYGRCPLWYACHSNHVEMVKVLIDKKAKVDDTTVLEACRRGNLDVITLFHEIGENIKRTTDYSTSLSEAIWGGNERMIGFLIDKGASVNTAARLGWLLLHAACINKKPQVVQCLLMHGADANMERWGDKPLHKAAELSSRECVDVLLKAGVNVNVQNANGNTPLHLAAGRKSIECVNVLLRAKADVNVQNTNDNTPLHLAAGRKSIECVNVLLRAKADVNVKNTAGDTPLHLAAGAGSEECVDALQRDGVDSNVQNAVGNTPLHSAAGRGSKGCIIVLLKAAADVNIQNRDGYTSLHLAIKRRAKESVNVLLKNDVDVNIKNTKGNTPLHTATQWGYADFVDALLKGGADGNVQNTHGNTPLHSAAVGQSKECITVLLNAGIDVNVQNEKGNTPLHSAIERGSRESVNVLLTTDVNVNVKNENGNTPLHTAARWRCKVFVDALLKACTDVNVQNTDGNTPLHSVAAGESPECDNILMDAGAYVNLFEEYSCISLNTVSERGARECIDVLMKAGALIDSANIQGRTPLHICLPDITVCETLLRHKAEINKQDVEGNTPLHLLCQTDAKPDNEDQYRRLTKILLDNGASKKRLNKEGQPALSGWCKTLIKPKSNEKNILTTCW